MFTFVFRDYARYDELAVIKKKCFLLILQTRMFIFSGRFCTTRRIGRRRASARRRGGILTFLIYERNRNEQQIIQVRFRLPCLRPVSLA